MTLDQIMVELKQQLRLTSRRRQTEVTGDVLKQLECGQFRIKDISRSQLILIQNFQQTADDQRLPSSHFTRQHYKSGVTPNAVVHCGERFAVSVRRKQEFGIGAHLERVTFQSKMVLVHS